MTIRKIGAEQPLLIDAAPIELEMRFDRLGKPSKQPHRHVGTHIFGCERIQITVAGDELIEVLRPAANPARLVSRNDDRKVLAANSIEQFRNQRIKRFTLDEFVMPIAS